jgi:hypothetical protein
VPVDPHSRRAVERRRPRRRLRFSSGRHDWLNVVAEEIVRTIFWFHPVLWWLIDRIQLSREHVVDEAVVALTKSRER